VLVVCGNDVDKPLIGRW